MASVQCHKPSNHTNHQVHSSASHQKPTQTHNDKNHTNQNNEQHSFSEKMKEMANSARKMFHHEPNGATAHQGGMGMEKKKKMGTGNKAEGGHCMPNMLDHMKKKKDKKKNRNGKNTFSFSDSGSSSESEDEKWHVKKN